MQENERRREPPSVTVLSPVTSQMRTLRLRNTQSGENACADSRVCVHFSVSRLLAVKRCRPGQDGQLQGQVWCLTVPSIFNLLLTKPPTSVLTPSAPQTLAQ